MPRRQDPIGYWVSHLISGYSYLRKYPGKRKRVRVTVPEHIRLYWHVEWPTGKRPARPPRYRRPPAPRPVPPKKRRVRRVPPVIEEALPPPPPLVIEEKVPAWVTEELPEERAEWISVSDFIADLEEEFGPIDISDRLYRTSPDGEVISMKDGLIWDQPLYGRTMSEVGATFIGVVRVWCLLNNPNLGQYFTWAWAKSYRLEGPIESVTEARLKAEALFDKMVEKAKSFEYREVHGGILAWTFWINAEKAPARPPA